MLLELAIGDAYGAGFEYVDGEMIHQHNNLSCYVKHPRHNIQPGSYTDDTQMSLAIAETIVSGEPWKPTVLAHKFVEVFQRDPREGYATGFYHFLLHVRDGEQFLRNIRPTSEKSGAAMRAAPIGIYPTLSLVIERCTIQAVLTHNTPDGINAAVVAALMTHYFLYNLGPKKELGIFSCAWALGHSLDRQSQVARMDECAGCGDCSSQKRYHEGIVEDMHSVFR